MFLSLPLSRVDQSVIFLKIMQRKASVERGPYSVKLMSSHVDGGVIPRPGDFVSVASESASYVADRVDFDFTTEPPTVEVWVK
jgi:hypothetical protein